MSKIISFQPYAFIGLKQIICTDALRMLQLSTVCGWLVISAFYKIDKLNWYIGVHSQGKM